MNIESINQSIQSQKDILLHHPLYQKVQTIEDLHHFLESHVYAVWDFMSLLKALQSKLTCTSTPWFPTVNTETRYLINEIVTAEESDLTLDGHRQSHFEMYLEAMQDCGANTAEVEQFLASIRSLNNIFVAIKTSELHPNIKAFLDFTFRVIEDYKTNDNQRDLARFQDALPFEDLIEAADLLLSENGILAVIIPFKNR